MDVNNQGLNLPSNLQNLDVRNELLSTELGSGASCAYSLRDLTGSNKNAVRVRRMPEDPTSSGDTGGNLNDERIFGAQEVQAGYVEDWVNGKLDNTLPCDVDTASAGYSLRKVKASYSGNAVRIRRSSDDIEVDVAFDADGKVSASSPITDGGTELTPNPDADLGSTTATTLGEFLTEDVNVETSDFSSGVDGYAIGSHGELTRVASFGGENDVIKYNQGGGSTPGGRNGIRNTDVTINSYNDYTITFKYYAPSAYNNYYLNVGYSFGNYTSPSNYFQITETGSWQTATLTMNAGFSYSSSILHLRVSSANTGTESLYGTTGSETIYYKDIVVTATNSGACVHTWYDQAGSNDAVQETASNQPKIAEGGALLADGIDFDGTDDYLEADGVSSIYTGTDEAHSSFVVVNSDVASTTQYILGIGNATTSNPIRNTLFHSGGSIGWQVRDDASTYKNDLSASPYVANQTYLVSALNSGTTIDFNTNSVINDNGTDADVGVSTINTVHIGTKANSPSNYLNGSIKEVIFYATDQSDNRFKIESNINNYYGLYNDELELNGQAKPASSAIIGGVTYSSGTLVTLPNKNSLEYTLNDTLTSNRFMRYMVNPNGNLTNLSNGDVVYVSFNLTAPDGLSIIAQLRDDFTGVSSTASFSGSGFKSFSLTRNSTSGTIDNIMFQSSGVGNATISMTDIKVSRIARNGFVETWYDQSDNGRDMSQVSAGQQPIIVNNGGQVKDPTNSKPSVKFGLQDDGTGGRNLRITSNIPEATTNAFTHFVVASIDRNDIANTRLTGGAIDLFLSSDEKLSTRFGDNRTGTTLPTLGINSTTLLGAVVTTGLVPTLHFNDSTATLTAHTGTGVPTIVQLLGENTIGGDSLNRYHLSGTMSEVILYLEDKGSDVSELKNNINNFYNLY